MFTKQQIHLPFLTHHNTDSIVDLKKKLKVFQIFMFFISLAQ